MSESRTAVVGRAVPSGLPLTLAADERRRQASPAALARKRHLH